MLKQLSFLPVLCIFLISCNDFKKTKGGLEYKIVTDKKGKTGEVGDMMIVNLKYANKIDSLDTYKNGSPIPAILDSNMMFPGSLEEGLMKLSSGDSAVFKVKNSVLYQQTFGAIVPEGLDSNDRTTFYVKVDTIYPKKLIEAEQKKRLIEDIAIVKAYKSELLDSAHIQEKIAADEKLIQKYLHEKDLKARRTENGTYVAILDSGNGEAAKQGQRIQIDYIGKLLTDSVFQNSTDLGNPFEFVLGTGEAIIGWDEAIEGLKKGAHAIIIIPSPLAYGKKGIPGKKGGYLIPPDTPVVFDIKIVNIKNS